MFSRCLTPPVSGGSYSSHHQFRDDGCHPINYTTDCQGLVISVLSLASLHVSTEFVHDEYSLLRVESLLARVNPFYQWQAYLA